MKKIILSTLLSLFTITLFSQIDHILNDYIINNQGDTKYGEIYQKKSKFHIEFVDSSGKKQTFRADKIKGYKKGVKEYRVKRVNDIPVYLRVVVEGPVTLYEVKDHIIEPSSEYLIEKGEVFVQFYGIFSIKNDLSELFNDYEELSKAIKDGWFDFENTAEIITLYNRWILNNKNNTIEFSSIKPYKSRQDNHKYIEGEKINLFNKTSVKMSSPSNANQYTDVFVEKSSDLKPIKLKNKKLAEIFKDHKILYDKIISGYYDLKDIETIVYIYNLPNNSL